MVDRPNEVCRTTPESTYTSEQVSQGQTVLNTPLRKALFLGGLVGFVVLAIVMAS